MKNQNENEIKIKTKTKTNIVKRKRKRKYKMKTKTNLIKTSILKRMSVCYRKTPHENESPMKVKICSILCCTHPSILIDSQHSRSMIKFHLSQISSPTLYSRMKVKSKVKSQVSRLESYQLMKPHKLENSRFSQ